MTPPLVSGLAQAGRVGWWLSWLLLGLFAVMAAGLAVVVTSLVQRRLARVSDRRR